MPYGLNRIRLLLATSTIAIALAGFVPQAGAEGSVYRMHRTGLRVRLEVHGNEISSTRIWARERCTDGFEGGASLFLHGPGQKIYISPSGSFDFRWASGGDLPRVHLHGHVFSRVIVGFYTAREREGPGSSIVCGTGRPDDRTLRFTARR